VADERIREEKQPLQAA